MVLAMIAAPFVRHEGSIDADADRHLVASARGPVHAPPPPSFGRPMHAAYHSLKSLTCAGQDNSGNHSPIACADEELQDAILDVSTRDHCVVDLENNSSLPPGGQAQTSCSPVMRFSLVLPALPCPLTIANTPSC